MIVFDIDTPVQTKAGKIEGYIRQIAITDNYSVIYEIAYFTESLNFVWLSENEFIPLEEHYITLISWKEKDGRE